MAKLPIVIIKYTFFVSLVFGAGFVIESLVGIKREWIVNPNLDDDLVYNASVPLKSRNYDKVFKKRYLRCLTEPIKPFCLLSTKKRLEMFRGTDEQSPSGEEIQNRLRNITSDFPSRGRRLHILLVEFTKIMKAYRINAILIEPSMLFCLLSSMEKFNMLSKGFNPGRVLGSRNIVSVGILNSDSKTLEEKNITLEMLNAGFKIIKFRKWIGDDDSQKQFETTHFIFVMGDVAIHAVVFYRKNDIMWHAGLDPKEIDFEGLLFVNEEIYENFTLLPLSLTGTSISRLFLPQDFPQFMREIEFSKITECRTNTSGIVSNKQHPNLTREQLITRVVIVLKELKAIFTPLATFFWLWSKSLLGWFTECDIFHFSLSLDLALHFKSIEGLNLTSILAENEFVKAENEFVKVENVTETRGRYGYELNCHGLLINIHFIRENEGFVWHKYKNEEVHVYKFPEFSLCSAVIYGQKVQVPCNVAQILEIEFSKNATLSTL